jgi:hypothetical protein
VCVLAACVLCRRIILSSKMASDSASAEAKRSSVAPQVLSDPRSAGVQVSQLQEALLKRLETVERVQDRATEAMRAELEALRKEYSALQMVHAAAQAENAALLRDQRAAEAVRAELAAAHARVAALQSEKAAVEAELSRDRKAHGGGASGGGGGGGGGSSTSTTREMLLSYFSDHGVSVYGPAPVLAALLKDKGTEAWAMAGGNNGGTEMYSGRIADLLSLVTRGGFTQGSAFTCKNQHSIDLLLTSWTRG